MTPKDTPPPQEVEGWEKKYREFAEHNCNDMSMGSIAKNENYIQNLLTQQRGKVIRELDKKYNSLCEEKVAQERQRLGDEIGKLKNLELRTGATLTYNRAIDEAIELIRSGENPNK